MNLRDMQYLISLAKYGHFGQAADACNVSQSTLSIQIRKLEDYLGFELFDRSLAKTCPTPAGEEILISAKKIVQEIDNIQEQRNIQKDILQGRVKVGIIPTLAPYYLPWILPILQKKVPNIKLELYELKTDILLKKLENGEIDAGIVALPINVLNFVEYPLFVEPFYIAIPSAHMTLINSIEKKVDLTILISLLHEQNCPILLLEDGHCLRGQALGICQMSSPQYETFRATSLETLRYMVRQGLGYTLIPALAVGNAINTTAKSLIHYHPMKEKNAHRIIGLITRTRHPRTKTLEILVEYFKTHIPKMVRSL